MLAYFVDGPIRGKVHNIPDKGYNWIVPVAVPKPARAPVRMHDWHSNESVSRQVNYTRYTWNLPDPEDVYLNNQIHIFALKQPKKSTINRLMYTKKRGLYTKLAQRLIGDYYALHFGQ